MADVRSLLRNELASRKGSASQTGKPANRVTKKRKVDMDDDLTRKKMRHAMAQADRHPASTVQPPSAQALEEDEAVEQEEQQSAGPELPPDGDIEPETQDTEEQPADQAAEAPTQNPQTIDEDEWAAFERDVAAPSRIPHQPAAVAAEATISAAPMTAEQLAAQQAKENETLSRSREAEVEGEREDAARFMEDEFDEMEQLEERVRRLKHMREALRNKKTTGDTETNQMDEAPTSTEQPADQPGNGNDENEDDEDDEDDDDDDDWYNWRFR